MSDLVLREDRERVAILTLNRPEALNALSPSLFVELRAHIDAIGKASGEIGCVILRGAGRSFCAGADLRARQRGDTEPVRWFNADTVAAMEALPQPIVVSVHGHCFTGGLELALGGDLLICGESAKFADTHGKWAMAAGWGLGQRLYRRIGPLNAKKLMFTAEPISAAEALRIGLVNDVVADDQLESATWELAQKIIGLSWFTLRQDKRMVNQGQNFTRAEGLLFERTVAGFGPDMAERVSTFGKKN